MRRFRQFSLRSLTIAVAVAALVILAYRHWLSWPSEADRRENREISEHFRNEAMIRKGEEIDMIGNLPKYKAWDYLQLTQGQKAALTELSELVNEARIRSWRAEAEPYYGHPAQRRREIARRDKRRARSIAHAQHLVTAGLLTEAQAACMVQRRLEGDGWGDLYKERVQDLIGVTPSQQRAIVQMGKDLTKQAMARIRPVAFSRGRQAEKLYKKLVNDSLQRQDLAVRKILTPVQLERWSGLAAKRPPPAAPADSRRSPPSDAEEAAVVIEDLSPTFRALATRASALGLNPDQVKLLARLKVVTGLGLIWIRREDLEAKSRREQAAQQSDSPFAHAPEDFLKHAEKVALYGILTEQQAEKVLKFPVHFRRD